MNTTDYTPTRPADFDYDAALSELQEKIRRKKKAKTLLAHFTEEAARLNSIVEDRFKEYETEQEEADAMKSATLALLLYSVLGLKEEKLQKEESEALAAKAEYESAKAELDHVLNRQVELRAEIRSLGNCERDYEEMVAEKKAWLMAKEVAVNSEVEALEAEKAAIIRDSKELKEAMESGQYALRVARSVMDALAKAQYLSRQDTRAPPQLGDGLHCRRHPRHRDRPRKAQHHRPPGQFSTNFGAVSAGLRRRAEGRGIPAHGASPHHPLRGGLDPSGPLGGRAHLRDRGGRQAGSRAGEDGASHGQADPHCGGVGEGVCRERGGLRGDRPQYPGDRAWKVIKNTRDGV